ncbi:tyrosine-type recombinase/integrase [Actinomycetospora soli]|uniref:tyrosine-type recombinase/integrase n=1 Tax=Actinomycetospora soli TaxID=2893887 RepID=UPI001E5217AA|nr:tyrosine-type recombinase/integrase [Actinomycetospora soli]MCD2191474.1 site-specific integrase [Actinomycetospora soli]
MAGEKRTRRANGEGSIYQRSSDGKWVGSAYVYTSSGQIKRRPVYGSSFDEVRAKLDELKVNSANGVPVPDRTYSVAQWFQRWLVAVREERRPTTYVGYENAVRLYIAPGLGKKALRRLTAADVRAFMAGVRERCLCCARGYDLRRPEEDRRCCAVGACCHRRPSQRQVQYVHAVLRNGLAAAEREELVTRNVAKLVKVSVPRYKVGKGLTVDQAHKLLDAAKDRRLYALYVVAATLGLRHGELLGLRWHDIDEERAAVTIAQTVQRADGRLYIAEAKTEASEATIPLPKVTRRVLEEHRRHQDEERTKAGDVWQEHDLVFASTIGTPTEPRNLGRDFEKVRELAGLPGVRLHDLRHTVVSLLLGLGTPPHVVQAIARHAHIDVTMSIYAHTNLDAMRQALDAIEWREL